MRRQALLRLAVVVALVGAGAAGWWASGRDAAPGPRADGAPMPAATELREPPRMPAAQVAARPPAPPQPAVSSAAPARGARQVWDLCGIGRVPVPAGDATAASQEFPSHLGDLPAAEARGKLMAALRQGDARARAAERYLNPPPDHDPRNAAEVDAIAAEIAELAGQDAVVLRWAVARCRSPSCRDPLLARWIALEPDNAVPRLGRMPAGEPDEALLHALRGARRFTVHWGSLAETLRRAMPADVPPYLRVALLVEPIGVEAAMQDDSLVAATALCRLPLPVGSGRRDACAALGLLMTDKADTLIAHQVGTRLRERAGLDPARAQAMRKTLDELSRPGLAGAFDSDQPFSCASVESTDRWVAAMARDGELAALRERAASGPPPAR